jgi:hypothetical protein
MAGVPDFGLNHEIHEAHEKVLIWAVVASAFAGLRRDKKRPGLNNDMLPCFNTPAPSPLLFLRPSRRRRISSVAFGDLSLAETSDTDPRKLNR